MCESGEHGEMDDASTLVALTVDVEPDWGVRGTTAIRQTLGPLLRLLAERGATATFFVVANLAEECRGLISAAAEQHEIGSHGLTHAILRDLSAADVGFELAESRRVLEERFGPVAGVRAPYFRVPPDWLALVKSAVYTYDASIGSVLPSVRNRQRPALDLRGSGVAELPTSHMADGLTPFSLTMLRAYGRAWRAFRPRRPHLFYMHLHELIEPGDLGALPAWMRPIQRRNAGPRAWTLLGQLLETPGLRFVSCKEFIASQLSTFV